VTFPDGKFTGTEGRRKESNTLPEEKKGAPHNLIFGKKGKQKKVGFLFGRGGKTIGPESSTEKKHKSFWRNKRRDTNQSTCNGARGGKNEPINCSKGKGKGKSPSSAKRHCGA